MTIVNNTNMHHEPLFGAVGSGIGPHGEGQGIESC